MPLLLPILVWKFFLRKSQQLHLFRFSSEQQSKAKMAAEIEELKRDYEDKLKEVTVTAKKYNFFEAVS